MKRSHLRRIRLSLRQRAPSIQCISVVIFFFIPFLLLASPHSATAQAPNPTTPAIAAPQLSLRELVRHSNLIVRLHVTEANNKGNYQGQIKRVLFESPPKAPSGEVLSFNCPSEMLPALPQQLWRGPPYRISEDLVLFARKSKTEIECLGGAAAFFDWIVSSDDLILRYRDVADLRDEDAAERVTQLLLEILQADPSLTDTYGVRAALVADWRALRPAISPERATVTDLVQRAFPTMINSVRFARRGSQFGLAVLFAPLLDLSQRQELVAALVGLYDSFAGAADVSRREAAILESLPTLIDAAINPQQETVSERSSAESIAAGREFAEGTFHTVAVPASWEAWVESLRNTGLKKSPITDLDAPSDLQQTLSKATDVVRATLVGEKSGPNFYLITIKVTDYFRRSNQNAQSFKYVRIAPEERALVQSLLAKDSPGRILLLRSVRDDVSLSWPFRGQSLSLVDPVRYELADAKSGIVPPGAEAQLKVVP